MKGKKGTIKNVAGINKIMLKFRWISDCRLRNLERLEKSVKEHGKACGAKKR